MGGAFLLARGKRSPVSARRASAPMHSLALGVAGAKTFAQTVSVAEGRKGSFVGAMMTEDGKDQRRSIFNVEISTVEGEPDAFDVAYQLDLAADPADASSALKVQGDVALRRGGGATTVECGPWTVNLALDGGSPSPGGAADATRLGNYRLSAELSKGRENARCRQTLKLGSQGNVVEGARDEKGSSLAFNAVATPSANAGAVDVAFQLEYRPSAHADIVQVQNQQTLALGRASRSQLSGYRFNLLAEGAPPSAAK